MSNKFNGCRLILASQSPRRQYLLKELGFEFEIMTTHVEEVYPKGLTPDQTAVYLAELKAATFDASRLGGKTIIISADTIVVLGEEILGKPEGHDAAAKMLQKLSGRRHEVITGVCLKSKSKQVSFFVTSLVYFKELTKQEIDYYISRFKPFDKAGGYGVQEWIGYIGISKIEGSYFNIMGLPLKELYEELLRFCPNNS
jgi:septum formation protein